MILKRTLGIEADSFLLECLSLSKRMSWRHKFNETQIFPEFTNFLLETARKRSPEIVSFYNIDDTPSGWLRAASSVCVRRIGARNLIVYSRKHDLGVTSGEFLESISTDHRVRFLESSYENIRFQIEEEGSC